ncbi:MAG: hypothetical protein V3R52_02300 [Candidatus Neomarinimicrobiota bacterium]
MKYIILLFTFVVFVFPQEAQTVTIITTDGFEIVGTIIEETDDEYQVETTSGIAMTIPKNIVAEIEAFSGLIKEGKLYNPDPNKSIYIFSPSAYPIGKGNKYFRDFWIVFPSMNFGLSDVFSLQLGGIWLPGIDLDHIPLIGSVKASLYQKEKLSLAGGLMYTKIADFGAGFIFATGTYGDNFNHTSFSLGWGYGNFDNKWEIMDRPIVVIAGNYRLSQSFALVTENWILPEFALDEIPLSLSMRFLGKKFSLDIGALIILTMLEEGLPIPILNFTYHF